MLNAHAVLQNADGLLATLRPLSRCDDADALAAEVEPPPPDEADAVERIREYVSQIKVSNEIGRLDAAQAAVDAAKE
ncbi:MAG: hypothetical protein F6K35_14285, partial [Okeania sp. SIO2H7]|nr:hypothetical protein [Okeania sp. SIO2H7]